MTFQTFMLAAALSIILPSHQAVASWVDPQTPVDARTTTGMKDARELTLIFSDEFNDPGRTFQDGADTRWTAEDRPAVVNAALQYYNSSRVGTNEDGKLTIQTVREDANWVEFDSLGQEFNFQRDYQSAMVTTWNKFCFTSGVIEISVQLPGKATRGGLWPAFWMLGNLARPNYLGSTNGVWPWSYDECGTSDEAVDADTVQKISNCKAGKGRGSPEIDIIEAQPGDVRLDYPSVPQVDGTFKPMSVGRPMISSSLQVSPGVANSIRPIVPNFPQDGQWYPPVFPMGGPAYGEAEVTSTPHMLNNYWYGQLIENDPPVWQDGLSVNWQHSTDYYSQQTVIRTEWQAGKDDGYVRWFNGEGQLMYEITADTLKGKPGAADAIAQIPYEAMYLILNTDVSPRWGWNGCNPQSTCMLANPGLCSPTGELLCRDCSDPECLKCPEETAWLADFCTDVQPENPAEYLIDYVRVYQDTTDPTHTVGCSPPDYPTKDYIEENWELFAFNSNSIKTAPLVAVSNGGGACTEDSDCRGNDQQSGVCAAGGCSCPSGWTGPHCLSPCIGEYAVNCATTQSNTTDPSDPSAVPTAAPSDVVSAPPSGTLSKTPSGVPTLAPVMAESATPTDMPSDTMTKAPAMAPSDGASNVTESPAPTDMPSEAPTEAPAPVPPEGGSNTTDSSAPTEMPPGTPTGTPTQVPVDESLNATESSPPTEMPSGAPVSNSSSMPSSEPTVASTSSGSKDENTFAECELNEACAALGLEGMCCPTVDDWTLDCCRGFRSDSEQCTENPKCSDLGLTGLCCPTVDDWLLDCCETVPDTCVDGSCEVRSTEVYLQYLKEQEASSSATVCSAQGFTTALLVSFLSLLGM